MLIMFWTSKWSSLYDDLLTAADKSSQIENPAEKSQAGGETGFWKKRSSLYDDLLTFAML